MPVPTNAVIAAMLENDAPRVNELLDAALGDPNLEPLTPETLNLLAEHRFVIDSSRSVDHLLMGVAFTHLERNLESTERADILIKVLDSLYAVSPNLYFDHLLKIAILIDKKRFKNLSHAASEHAYYSESDYPYPGVNDKSTSALKHLTKALAHRIRSEPHSIVTLKAFLAAGKVPSTKSLSRSLKFISTSERINIDNLKSRSKPDLNTLRSALVQFFPKQTPGHPVEPTLFSAILQNSLFHFSDYGNPPGHTILEILCQHDPDLKLLFPESDLLNYFYPKIYNPHSMTFKHMLETHDERALVKDEESGLDYRDAMAARFRLIKRYFADELTADKLNACVEKLYRLYTNEVKDPSDRYIYESSSYVYPAWFISTMLTEFGIDINRPFHEGEKAPIVHWFETTKQPLAFKHFLRIDGVNPTDEQVKAIVDYIKKEIQQGKPSVATFERIRTKAEILTEKLKLQDKHEAFIKQMEAIGLFKPPVVVVAVAQPEPTPAPEPTTVAPRQEDESEEASTEKKKAEVFDPVFATRCIIQPEVVAGMHESYLNQYLHKLAMVEPTDELLSQLITSLKNDVEDEDLDKNNFISLKNAINTFIISNLNRKKTVTELLNQDPQHLDETVKKNYLLYLLALGRTHFELHTQKGFLGRQNHFTALNDYLHDKPLDDNTRRKFGLFEAATGKAGYTAAQPHEKSKPRKK